MIPRVWIQTHMSRFRCILLPVAVLVVVATLQPVTLAAETPVQQDQPAVPGALAPLACYPDGQQDSGAIYRICMPLIIPWNGDLVVYAHGYVSPTKPVGIPEDQMVLPGGVSIDFLVNFLGYGFATTSYSTNGLAVREGLADLVDVADIFAETVAEPDRVLLVGVSEGGLITALAVEGRPDVFDGGLALCGPYGDFAGQVNHVGDFRVVFDYFFPDLMPGDSVEIPEWLMADWDNYYQTNIQSQIQDPANAGKVDQLLNVTAAAYDPADASTKEATTRDLLWYNVFATNDAVVKLGGQPFDNEDRVYTGSDDDAALNQEVQRFPADPAALDEIEGHYQTSGRLAVPLVTLHTTGDPIVPYWHALLYRAKTIAADNIALHEHRTAARYGHCNFTATELLEAFGRLEEMVWNPPPYRPAERVYLPLVVGPQ